MPLFFPQLFLFYLLPTRKFGHHQPGCDPAPSWGEVRRGQNLGRRQKAGEGEEREQERARRPGGGELGEREREGREERERFSAPTSRRTGMAAERERAKETEKIGDV